MPRLLTLICLALALATNAHALTVTVEFSYSGVAAGFRLYQNGVQLCETNDGVARVMECPLSTIIGVDDSYTMTAIIAPTVEGDPASESPYSSEKRFGRVKAFYRRIRGGAFAGGSM